jgi:DNA invertase Pin-like site-specific DNA recombinase
MKAYFYGRHSTLKQGVTEEVQRAACEAYFKNTLADKKCGHGGWFYDAATSGGKKFTDRPEGLRVWVMLQPGDFLVVSKLDRAFRSVIDGATTVELLRARGAHFVALDLGLDSSTPMGEFALHVFLAAAQLQRRCAGERTREALLMKSAKGVPIGRAATSTPYGWRRVGRGSSSYLVPFEEERQRIEELHRWRTQGLSLERICIRTSNAEHRWLNEGRRWYPTSVSAALEARDRGFPRAFIRSRRTGANR